MQGTSVDVILSFSSFLYILYSFPFLVTQGINPENGEAPYRNRLSIGLHRSKTLNAGSSSSQSDTYLTPEGTAASYLFFNFAVFLLSFLIIVFENGVHLSLWNYCKIRICSHARAVLGGTF